MPAILIADSLSQEGRDVFEKAPGFTVDYKPEITPEEMKETIGNYEGVVIRSRASVTAEILTNPGRLRVVGRAGVGLDNVDIEAATAKGVIVMNTPGGNTVSTAENTMSMLLSLARNTARADSSMKAGRWDKKKLSGVELKEKTIGVIGLGRIGREVAKRAKGFEMKVLGFDPFASKELAARAGIELVDLDTIWANADFITVHTPLTDDTKAIINKESIAKMKPTVRLINCARGGIIHEESLIEALKEGRVAGAALDVYESEPLAEDHPLRTLDNVVLTPHLSASTSEAQEKVAVEIAQQIVDTLSGKAPRNAVNAPSLDPEILEQLRPYLGLAENLGKFLAQYVAAPIEKLSITFSGEVLDHPTEPLTTAATIGYLSSQTDTAEINYVNAGYLLRERGVELIESRSSQLYQYANLITLTAKLADNGEVSVSGTLFTSKAPRLVMLNGKHFNARPSGAIVVVENKDVPGIVGMVGTIFGEHNINIAHMTWGRSGPGGEAITLLNCDQEVTPAVLKRLSEIQNVTSIKLIRL